MGAAEYLILLAAGFCGAMTQSLVKQWSSLNGHRSLTGKLFNLTSAGIILAATAELFLVRYLYRRGMPLIDVVILQEMFYFLSIIILGVVVHGETITLTRGLGIGSAIASIILMKAGQNH